MGNPLVTAGPVLHGARGVWWDEHARRVFVWHGDAEVIVLDADTGAEMDRWPLPTADPLHPPNRPLAAAYVAERTNAGY